MASARLAREHSAGAIARCPLRSSRWSGLCSSVLYQLLLTGSARLPVSALEDGSCDPGKGRCVQNAARIMISTVGFCRVGTYPLLRSRPLRVPLLQRLTLEEPQSKQRAFAPPLGASPRLGMPAVRHCSVGPPRSAIPGRVAATPASMPGCPLRNACLRPSWFNGAPKIKSRATARSCTPLWERACPRWRPKKHIRVSGIHLSSLTTIAGKPAPTGVRARFDDQVGSKAASLCF
ncbi:Uncharacterised protein [Pseudomonas fluorescens]|nr:Uncharacterised protein [Pseudomonas fluorescens]